MVSSDGTKITKSQTCARSLFLQKNFEEQKVDKRGCSARMGRIPAICFTSEGHGGLSSWECQENSRQTEGAQKGCPFSPRNVTSIHTSHDCIVEK